MWTLLISMALADDATVHHRLSARHPLTCEQVVAGVEDRFTALKTVAEQATMPPWAPLRAMTCLIELEPEKSEPLLLKWSADPGLKGAAVHIAKQVHKLPSTLQPKVRSALLNGPHRAVVEGRITPTVIQGRSAD